MIHDNLKKVQGKQKTYYVRRARSRSFKVRDNVLLLLPTDSHKLLLMWKSSFEVIKVLNRINYQIDVNIVIGTYDVNI